MNQDWCNGDAAQDESECESEREDVERARLRHALGDEVAWQPVPDADLAGHVKKEVEAEQQKQWLGQQRREMRGAHGRGSQRRRHGREGFDGENGHGQHRDGGGEARPVFAEEVGGEEGRGESAEAEEEVDDVEHDGAMLGCGRTGQRVGAGDHDASACAQ